MVPTIEKEYILLLGHSILYKEYDLARFSHQKNTTQVSLRWSHYPQGSSPWACIGIIANRMEDDGKHNRNDYGVSGRVWMRV